MSRVFFYFFKFIRWYIFAAALRLAHTSKDYPNLRIQRDTWFEISSLELKDAIMVNDILLKGKILMREIRFSGKNSRPTGREYRDPTSIDIQFDQVTDIHLQHFQAGQDALGVSV